MISSLYNYCVRGGLCATTANYTSTILPAPSLLNIIECEIRTGTEEKRKHWVEESTHNQPTNESGGVSAGHCCIIYRQRNSDAVTAALRMFIWLYTLCILNISQKCTASEYELLIAFDLNRNVYFIKYDTKSATKSGDNKLHYLFRSQIRRFLLLIQIVWFPRNRNLIRIVFQFPDTDNPLT